MGWLITRGYGPEEVIDKIKCDLTVNIDTPAIDVDVDSDGALDCAVDINELTVAIDWEDEEVTVDGGPVTDIAVEV